MRRKAFKVGILCRLIIALILALGLIPIGEVPASALSLGEYFVISYDVSFSKNEVYLGEVFYATVTTQVTCTKDLLLPISEAFVTGRVVAQHEESGDKLVLNSSYTVSINPFPVEKEGDVTQISQLVPLQFPVGSRSGSYNVAGEVIKARAQVAAIWWWTITSYLPSSQSMGSITYLSDRGDSGDPPLPDPVEPAPLPVPVEPAPSPVPVGPAPSPVPVEPAPLPVPVEPAPQPVPVEPAPSPVPVEPAPQPDPVEPAPPDPVEPATSPVPLALAPQTSIPTTTPPKSTNWWLVGGIYTVDLALLATILWLSWRRRLKR